MAKVYAAVRVPHSPESLVETDGASVVPIAVDLVDPETINAAAAIATDVDIVVNNAGILKNASPFDSHAIEVMSEEIEVNVFGLLRIAQAFGPVLKANGGSKLTSPFQVSMA